MKRLRQLHAIAAVLCGAAIAAVLFDAVRVALVAIVVVLVSQVWSLEVLRTDRNRRETRR